MRTRLATRLIPMRRATSQPVRTNKIACGPCAQAKYYVNTTVRVPYAYVKHYVNARVFGHASHFENDALSGH
ncbi:hypothetical protein JYU34_022830, partial [Plutella xylostella]